MKRLLISPTPNEDSGMYISNLALSLSKYFRIVNYGKKSEPASKLLIRYFFKTDIFMLNWTENELTRKNGFIRKSLIKIFLCLIKISNKKIIWTFHNLETHNTNNYEAKKLASRLKQKADIIIHHTSESLHLTPNSNNFYSFHPFEEPSTFNFSAKKNDYKYDLLIWGRIEPYKGVVEFLEYASTDNYLRKIKILIIGKTGNQEYKKKILNTITDNITFKDKFISNEELSDLHKVSKYVFFPHQGKSVLNSGQLVVSLGYGANILAPNIGSFKELANKGLIKKYDNFSQVSKIIQNNTPLNKQKQFQFIIENSWDNFAKKFNSKLSHL